jgi:ABC-type phosphate transport system substrate-binding protein
MIFKGVLLLNHQAFVNFLLQLLILNYTSIFLNSKVFEIQGSTQILPLIVILATRFQLKYPLTTRGIEPNIVS